MRCSATDITISKDISTDSLTNLFLYKATTYLRINGQNEMKSYSGGLKLHCFK